MTTRKRGTRDGRVPLVQLEEGSEGRSMSGVWHRTSSSKRKWSYIPFALQLLAFPHLCLSPV